MQVKQLRTHAEMMRLFSERHVPEYVKNAPPPKDWKTFTLELLGKQKTCLEGFVINH